MGLVHGIGSFLMNCRQDGQVAALAEFGKGTGVKGSDWVDFHSKHTGPSIFIVGRSRQSLKACVACVRVFLRLVSLTLR